MHNRRTQNSSRRTDADGIPDTPDRQTLDWLYQNVWVAVAGGIASYLVLTLVLWPSVQKPLLLAWLCLGLLVALARAAAAWSYGSDAGTRSTRPWLWAHRGLTLASGVHFALAALFLFPPGDAERQSLILVLTAGMVASAVGFHALDRLSVQFFTLPPTLSVAWRYAMMDTTLGWGVAGLAVVFTLTMWRAGEAVRGLVMRNIELSQSLHHLASHDPLVPLANRTEFMRRLRAAAALAAHEDSGAALLYVATRPATRRCGGWARRYAMPCAPATWPRAWVATSSSCCCTRARRTPPSTSPTSCWRASAACAGPRTTAR